MQTFRQTFTGSTTWVLNVTGKYFTTLLCTNPINVRFYKGGKQLDLGQISQLLAGLEVTLGDIADLEPAFDRVEMDVTGADTVQIGIGNGQARYNRSQGSVAITNVNGVFLQDLKTVTSVSANIFGVNAARRYLMMQNKSTTTDVYINMAGGGAWSGGIKLGPGDSYELSNYVPTNAIQAATLAGNADIATVES